MGKAGHESQQGSVMDCYGKGVSRVTPSFLTSVAKWMMVQDQIRGGAGWEDKNHKFSLNSL